MPKKREIMGVLPCSFIRGTIMTATFFNNSKSWLKRSTWNQFIAAIRAPTKFRMGFYNFYYYFWGQHCSWTDKSIIGNEVFYFYGFHCPPLFQCPPALLLLQYPWIYDFVHINKMCKIQYGSTVTWTPNQKMALLRLGYSLPCTDKKYMHETLLEASINKVMHNEISPCIRNSTLTISPSMQQHS